MNPQDLLPLITGTSGAVVVMSIVIWYQAGEKKALQQTIKDKDDDLKSLTKDSIAGITTLAGLNQANQKWQESITNKLDAIKDSMP